jgi:hypothetical protein
VRARLALSAGAAAVRHSAVRRNGARHAVVVQNCVVGIARCGSSAVTTQLSSEQCVRRTAASVKEACQACSSAAAGCAQASPTAYNTTLHNTTLHSKHAEKSCIAMVAVSISRILVLAHGMMAVAAKAGAGPPSQPPTGPNICATNRSIGQAVMAAVNLSWPGLGSVQSAAAAGDLGGACEALADYYREGDTSAWLRIPTSPAPSSRKAGGDADDLVEHDIFHLSGVGQVAKVPRNPDGGIDWLDHGPKNDPE